MNEVIISLTETTRLRVADSEFKGKNYRDVRIQFINGEGEWCFTKKGVAIPEGLEVKVADAIIGRV